MRQALSPSYRGGWRKDRRRRDFSARSLAKRALRVGSAKWEQLSISIDTFRSHSCHDSVQLIREHLLAILRNNRLSAMARLASLTLLMMCAPALPEATAQQIRFFCETIIIGVASDSCLVEGIYVFANPAPERAVTTLLYPFAISNGLPPPLTVGCGRKPPASP